MAVTGTDSTNQDMRVVVQELEVNGVDVTPAAAATAITDLALTGTYSTDDDGIEAAINGILAILRSNGMLASS